MWDREPCHCKDGYKAKHVVWYAWKVDWNSLREKLSPECRRMLKEEFICKECHGKITAEVKNILNGAVINA
jgi:hypothetical protein